MMKVEMNITIFVEFSGCQPISTRQNLFEFNKKLCL